MTMFEKRLNAYVLLDRTGSMANRWRETLAALNAYVEELRQKRIDGVVTVACFDYFKEFKFELLRKHQSIRKWKSLSDKDASPRGFTPLYDALVRIISMAEAANRDNTLIVIVTDGAENSSKEASRNDVSEAIRRCKAKQWQIVFLGADFDAFQEARNIGVYKNQVLQMSQGNYEAAVRDVARHTLRYVRAGKDFDFTDEDRRRASKKPPASTENKNKTPGHS